jgi:uncharacterized protein YcbX
VTTGLVSKLWRYPVKSMLGETCREVEVNVRGVHGDRRFAIRNAEGKFGSGKNTRRFCQIDGLFAFHASDAGDWPDIVFPDGRLMHGADASIHGALSSVLGMAVTLVREQQISHFDSGPVHLISSGALAWLAARLPQSRIDERRFRPNIVVATPGAHPAEHAWMGKTLRIGAQVRLKVTAPTERCRMTTLAQSGLPDDPRILRCIAQESELQFGVYADVVTPGRVSCGEPVVPE